MSLLASLDSATPLAVSSNTVLSGDHTCAGLNLTLTVKIAYNWFDPAWITSVTYNGIPLTVVPLSANAFTYGNVETIVYKLVRPPVGTFPVVIECQYATNIIALVESWNNTTGEVELVSFDAEFGSPTPGGGSYQFTPNLGDIVTTFIAYNSSTVPTPGGGLTLATSDAVGSSFGAASSYVTAPSTSLITYSWSGIGGTGYATTGIMLQAGPQLITTRTHPPGLLTSASRCAAVLIQRQDGSQFGLTDTPYQFSFNGLTYQTLQGADASNVHQEAGTGVDDFEVATILNDALNYVTSTDVRGTRYNNSWWTLFEIDYLNPSAGAMIIGTYRCSRVQTTDTGMKFVLLSIKSILKQTTGRVYSANCDVLRFGDIRCDPSQTVRAAMSTSMTVCSAGVADQFTVDFTGGTKPSGYYNFGDATFTAGANDGLAGQIKAHIAITPGGYSSVVVYALGDYSTYGGSTWISLQAGNLNHVPAAGAWWLQVAANPATVTRVVFRTPAPYQIAIGDVATLCFGCDRRKATCMTVPNASNPSTTNVENFHGWYLPNPDVINVVGKSNVQ